MSLLFFQLDFSSYVHPTGGVDILFLLFLASAVRHPPSVMLGFQSLQGKISILSFGMGVYWVNSLHGITFGEDSSITE